MSADDENDYGGPTRFGFIWGPAEVTRCALLPDDRRVVQIKTPHRTLDVYVSGTGRSVRVFEDGRELTAELRDERDRYRAALEVIANSGGPDGSVDTDTAREALA